MRGVLTRRGHERWRNGRGANMYGKAEVVRLEAGVKCGKMPGKCRESVRGLKRWLGMDLNVNFSYKSKEGVLLIFRLLWLPVSILPAPLCLAPAVTSLGFGGDALQHLMHGPEDIQSEP